MSTNVLDKRPAQLMHTFKLIFSILPFSVNVQKQGLKSMLQLGRRTFLALWFKCRSSGRSSVIFNIFRDSVQPKKFFK